MEHSGRGTDSYSFLKNAEVEVGKINDRTERSAARLDLLEMFLVLYVKKGWTELAKKSHHIQHELLEDFYVRWVTNDVKSPHARMGFLEVPLVKANSLD